MYDELVKAMNECQDERVISTVEEKLAADAPVREILESLIEGLRLLGDRFARCEAFIPELVYAGEIFNKAMEKMGPKLSKAQISMSKKGKVVMATVKGDLHDIGKNLVVTFLKLGGYDVIDLGHDVPNERLVEAVEVERPDVIGLSALLTTTMFNQRTFIEMLKEKGLRDKVKVIVGGAPVTQSWAKEIGADAFGADAVDGKNKVDLLLGNQGGVNENPA